jgi:uncharacterized membrane protein
MLSVASIVFCATLYRAEGRPEEKMYSFKNFQGHEFEENPRCAASYPGYCVGIISLKYRVRLKFGNMLTSILLYFLLTYLLHGAESLLRS